MKLEELHKMGMIKNKAKRVEPESKSSIQKEDRKEAVRLLESGERCIDVALITGINESTVRGINASLK